RARRGKGRFAPGATRLVGKGLLKIVLKEQIDNVADNWTLNVAKVFFPSRIPFRILNDFVARKVVRVRMTTGPLLRRSAKHRHGIRVCYYHSVGGKGSHKRNGRHPYYGMCIRMA